MSGSPRERLRYWFDRTMSKGTPALIGWLGLASIALILLVTALAMIFTPQDVAGHPLAVAWMSLLRTLDPGTMGGDHGSALFLGLMLFVTVGGIFIVSALVGVLATGLDGKLAELRKGRSRVVERGHLVILGWSEEVFTVITELIKAQEGDRNCVVILASRDKVTMEDEIRAKIRRSAGMRIVCRTGDPTDPLDLELVRPDEAGVIVVPAEASADRDIRLIKTLLALRHRSWGENPPPVVAVVSDSTNMPAAALAGGLQVQLIDAEDITARLIVQSRRQSGLSVVCNELLSFDGDEIYLCGEPSLAGRTYRDALLAYETASLIGIRRSDGSVLVNPPADTGLRSDDELIVFALSRAHIRLSKQPPSIIESAVAVPAQRSSPVEATLILGWNGRGPTIVELLDRYLPEGSLLEVAAPGVDNAVVPPGSQYAHVSLSFRDCDPTQRRALQGLALGRFQHVIVLADDTLAADQADARNLVTLLHLRDLKERGEGSFAIVSELNDDANRRLAEVTRADDFVVGNKMISLLLTQLSRSPRLNDIFAELFEARGSDIYLKRADDYVVAGVEATFATVIDAAARRGETAIGLRLQRQALQPPNYGIDLNPDKSRPILLGVGDRVVVLATS